ncbi:MAG: hypothetical protein KDD47_21725 [Acidobacteria bacterium]|nr:hypothetical protein [Acidobacteriota bacterium]
MNFEMISNDPAQQLPGLGNDTGHTIFEPDDGSHLGLIRVQCATCEDGFYLERIDRAPGSLGTVSTRAYNCGCSNGECKVRVTFQVAGEGLDAWEVATAAGVATVDGPPQTIFHPDDGVPLSRVLCLCGCGSLLARETKHVEDLELGRWTAYSCTCRGGRCSTRITLRVPHLETVKGLVG